MNNKIWVLIGIIGVFVALGALTELGITGGFITKILDPLTGRMSLTPIGFEEFDVYEAFYKDGELTVMIRNQNRFENTLHIVAIAYKTDKDVTRIDRRDVDLRLDHVFPSVLTWKNLLEDTNEEIDVLITYYYAVNPLEEKTFLVDQGKILISN